MNSSITALGLALSEEAMSPLEVAEQTAATDAAAKECGGVVRLKGELPTEYQLRRTHYSLQSKSR